MQQTLSEIKKKLRLVMDGANSSAMRKKGLQYKLNFGVPIMTLRQMAKQYPQNTDLAKALWLEDIRELKILATLIQPSDEFTMADEWIKSINNIELAEQICMNLLQNVPGSDKFAGQWIKSTELYVRICGFLLYARLFMKNTTIEIDNNLFFNEVFKALGEESLLLRNSALTALKRLGKQSALKANNILAQSENQILRYPEMQYIYDELKFEFDYLNLTT